MSRDFPAFVDPWQAAKGRRFFSGSWPERSFARWADLLDSADGEVRFEIQFDIDSLGIPRAQMRIMAYPRLLCQRTLEPFGYEIDTSITVGFVEHDEDQDSLPANYEPHVVVENPLRLTDLVEDELILAIPLIPARDDAPPPPEPQAEAGEEPSSAFAALAALKGSNGKAD